jgi:hypothetical protein
MMKYFFHDSEHRVRYRNSIFPPVCTQTIVALALVMVLCQFKHSVAKVFSFYLFDFLFFPSFFANMIHFVLGKKGI